MTVWRGVLGFGPEALGVRFPSWRYTCDFRFPAETVRLLPQPPAFGGRSRLDQHRMVNAALQEMLGQEIHALGLKTLAPCEWKRNLRWWAKRS